MKPPICEVCNDRFDPADGGLVRFLQTAARAAFDEQAKQPGFVGHPPDAGWFCAVHVEAARARSSVMTRQDAVQAITVEPASPSLPAPRTSTSNSTAAVEPGEPPIDLRPDLVDVDLRGGTVLRSRFRRGPEPKTMIEWTLTPVTVATVRHRFLDLLPGLFDDLDLGPVPELVVTEQRKWTPMDGAREPDCPYSDLVRHEALLPDGRPSVSVESDQTHWNDDNISSVSVHLVVNYGGALVRAYASGRDHHDACTTLTLVRPTSATALAAITDALAPWLVTEPEEETLIGTREHGCAG